ncbi:MAG: BLUF domain-containing protein [Pelagimonas sp.]|jgi:hypothetical protein|nr:BLUF domain-containing protein [Pelagimonas sp.]
MRFQILYTSISTHPRGHVSDLDILKKAQSANRELGLTGFLLRAPNRFIQILEGDYDHVTRIMSRIRKDPNHTITQEMSHLGPSPRMFQDWSMGYADIPEAEGAKLTETFAGLYQEWAHTLHTLREIATQFSQTRDPGHEKGPA